MKYAVGVRVQDLVVTDHVKRGQAQNGTRTFTCSLCLAFFAADEAQYLLLVAAIFNSVVAAFAVGVVLRLLIRIDRFFNASRFVDLA